MFPRAPTVRMGEPPKCAFLMKFARGGAKGEDAPPCAEGGVIP